jgi:hypothetical protein
MEHLSLEVFDLTGTGSKFATLPEDTTITIVETSDVFASGNVWSHNFTLNAHANAHIFGTVGDMRGSRLHDLVDRRRARLYISGVPVYYGYLKLDSEAEIDSDGNFSVSFECGQKTFEERIDGVSAREVSVGDVIIGVALNRVRETLTSRDVFIRFTLDGLAAACEKDTKLKGINEEIWGLIINGDVGVQNKTSRVQRWPKLVKSHGKVWNGDSEEDIDFTNVQTPYDAGHSFCNVNICYPLKVNKNGEDITGRGYTLRSAHDKPTTDGGDNQTRYNNAPNFYLLHFIDRLFKDMNIFVEENQTLNVEDLKRVFMLNYGCHYEEIETEDTHMTPDDKLSKYGQYYIPFVKDSDNSYILENWDMGCVLGQLDDVYGKVLLKNIEIDDADTGNVIYSAGSIEGKIIAYFEENGTRDDPLQHVLSLDDKERYRLAYSGYLAYATGNNYPNVDISEIIDAMKTMFGVRFLFNRDYTKVRIVLLRNIFRNSNVQRFDCEVLTQEKTDNNTRGFRVTYGKGKDDTSFYYKGFADLFQRAHKTWIDNTDKHDYSQWDLDADYGTLKISVSAMDKRCYVTPNTGNAYIVKVDEDEDVLFPSLLENAGFMDAEDGDCSLSETEPETVEEIQIGATPAIPNEIGNTYAMLFNGEMKAPAPDDVHFQPKILTFGKLTKTVDWTDRRSDDGVDYIIKGKLDSYLCEGFIIKLEDNYSVADGDTPFDNADPGLCFGIMRGSGPDAFVRYSVDPDDNEENDTWDVEPGSGAVCHPDTCDSYGNMFDYNGTTKVSTVAEAIAALQQLWPNSNIDLVYTDGHVIRDESTCIYTACGQVVTDSTGKRKTLLFASPEAMPTRQFVAMACQYAWNFEGMTDEEMYQYDASANGNHWLVETDSSDERLKTLLELEWRAFVYCNPNRPTIIDHGVGSKYGRFSLKLRANKPNPEFDPLQPETHYDPEHPEENTNPRYLHITDEDLQRRGIVPQFYSEYSYWVLNARVAVLEVRMELAQMLTIDKSVRAEIAGITGFIRKMQFNVNNKTGMGTVKMEILYI